MQQVVLYFFTRCRPPSRSGSILARPARKVTVRKTSLYIYRYI